MGINFWARLHLLHDYCVSLMHWLLLGVHLYELLLGNLPLAAILSDNIHSRVQHKVCPLESFYIKNLQYRILTKICNPTLKAITRRTNLLYPETVKEHFHDKRNHKQKTDNHRTPLTVLQMEAQKRLSERVWVPDPDSPRDSVVLACNYAVHRSISGLPGMSAEKHKGCVFMLRLAELIRST